MTRSYAQRRGGERGLGPLFDRANVHRDGGAHTHTWPPTRGGISMSLLGSTHIYSRHSLHDADRDDGARRLFGGSERRERDISFGRQPYRAIHESQAKGKTALQQETAMELWVKLQNAASLFDHSTILFSVCKSNLHVGRA